MAESAGSGERVAAFRVARGELGDVSALSESRIRSALVAALARHGVADASDAELQFSVDLVRSSPRRAGWRLLGRQVKTLAKALTEVHQIVTADDDGVPEWARVPASVPRVPWGSDDLPETSFAEIELRPEDVAGARETVARLISDFPEGSDGDDRMGRSVDCWICLAESDVLSVFVGTNRIAQLPIDSEPVRQAIRLWGRDTRSLYADAMIYGADPATATIELSVETPTG